MARLQSVPYRVMASSRYINCHYWAWNKYYESPEFEAEYETRADESGTELVKPYLTHLENRSVFIEEIRPARLLAPGREGDRAPCLVAGKRLRKGQRAIIWARLLDTFARIYNDWRRLERLATSRLTDLGKTPFVFYPPAPGT